MTDSRSSCQHIETLAALDATVAQSHDRPVLLFKHSLTCGTSAHANDELRAFLGGGGENIPVCGLIVVQHARPVSSAVVERFGVRHESPQALLLRDGRVVWHASHWRITARALEDAIVAANAQA
jgi:bacillithiol system protein YtxJ